MNKLPEYIGLWSVWYDPVKSQVVVSLRDAGGRMVGQHCFPAGLLGESKEYVSRQIELAKKRLLGLHLAAQQLREYEGPCEATEQQLREAWASLGLAHEQEDDIAGVLWRGGEAGSDVLG